MRVTKSFTLKDLNSGQKIIIYGAGRYGELALRGLQYLKLQPMFFADRFLAGEERLGIKVIEPSELQNYKDDVILIASYNHFYEMLSFLQDNGNLYYYDILELLKLNYDECILSEYLLDEKRNWQKYEKVIETVVKKGLIIPHCEIVITECCTLKCRDCSDLMQYYTHPENLDINEIIRTFGNFLDSIDGLSELRILGGEPFICKDIYKVIETFQHSEKVKRITIYTNSTIVPSDEVIESLKNDKVSVHMSNYGRICSKLEKLRSIFIQEKINFYVHDYEKWYEIGNLEKRNYSSDIRDMIYQNCMQGKCHTFYRGKFYLCPRSAHGEHLKIFKNGKNEVVDFTDNEIDINKKRKELYILLEKKESLTACDYCNGLNANSKMVEAAIQLEHK
jgi:organic radical activating enzyme